MGLCERCSGGMVVCRLENRVALVVDDMMVDGTMVDGMMVDGMMVDGMVVREGKELRPETNG